MRELEPNQTVTSIFLVHSKEVRQKRNGGTYLSMLLADRTGRVDARMWDGAEEVLGAFEREDFVKVRGLVEVHQNRRQMTVLKLRRAGDAEVDLGDYFPRTEKDVDQMWAELRAAVAGMSSAPLRALLEAFLDDEEIAARYRTAPAAKSLHHARIGGLLEHVASLVRLARATAPNYPFVDPDLLLTGVVLHDIGKIYELRYERSFGYTSEGQLVGHMAIALRMLDAKTAAVPGFPARLKTLVEHLILSHHGRYEFGSPRLPMFPEAVLLHYLDDLDAKLESMRTTLQDDPQVAGEWTSYNPSLDRALLKKEKFLAGPEPAEPAPAPKDDNADGFEP